jgi:hypothetical protein
MVERILVLNYERLNIAVNIFYRIGACDCVSFFDAFVAYKLGLSPAFPSFGLVQCGGLRGVVWRWRGEGPRRGKAFSPALNVAR